MKSSFLFTRLCVLISILASGTLIFLLLRAIYYPELSILLLLVIVLCHLLTTQYKKTHPMQIPVAEPYSLRAIPPEVKKALAEALGSVASFSASEKIKFTASERATLVSERDALLTIAHFFESVESMRSDVASPLEELRETTSLTEVILASVDARRAAFLKKGIVLMYRTQKLKNEYININQKHLKRIVDTLLKSIVERSVRGRVTLTQSESVKTQTVSLTMSITLKKANTKDELPVRADVQYATLERLIARYGGTITFNTENLNAWTTCVCTFPSHT